MFKSTYVDRLSLGWWACMNVMGNYVCLNHMITCGILGTLDSAAVADTFLTFFAHILG